jgi:6-pyruvoyltetrahydropterin/6-carboxytetrahydropterin synthase
MVETKMYEVAKTFRFCAAHHNPNDDGPCRRNHGHNWAVEFMFRGETLDQRGWLIAFDDIRREAMPLVRSLDHEDLNEILPFNPTCELLARYLFDTTSKMPLPIGVSLVQVRVTENAGEWTTYATYRP